MKIAVVGAAGRTGRRVVERALERGDEVVAIARDPRKLAGAGDAAPGRMRTVAATAVDVAALTAAFQGVDAVVSTLGHNKTSGTEVLAEGITATLTAMDAAGVHRLVVVSASGHLTDGDALPVRVIVKPILGAFLREQFADMRVMERIVKSSDADWTIMRPPMLTDKDARGTYRSRRDGNVRGSFRMTRDGLAAAILDQLGDQTTIRQAVSVAD